MGGTSTPSMKDPEARDARVVTDATVRFGKPVIRGTRVTVAEVVGRLASGMSHAEVAADFEIELEDVFAALAYAARSVANEHRWAE